MPLWDPTNSTMAPRSRKLSATHSAGIAWPPVPPPAIKIRGAAVRESRTAGAGCDLSGSFTVLRYPVEDAHGGEAYEEARTAVADERQRYPGEREYDHGSPHVEDGLHREHRGEPGGHAAGHHRGGAEGDLESGQRDEPEGGDHEYHSQEPELLADQHED